jgi:hypothetical protein
MKRDLSQKLLQILRTQKARSWADIVTLDESWFYLATDYELIWLDQGGKVPERERYLIQSPEFMLIIAWNPSGFYVVDVLQKGQKFNAGYDVSAILEPLVAWC